MHGLAAKPESGHVRGVSGLAPDDAVGAVLAKVADGDPFFLFLWLTLLGVCCLLDDPRYSRLRWEIIGFGVIVRSKLGFEPGE